MITALNYNSRLQIIMSLGSLFPGIMSAGVQMSGGSPYGYLSLCYDLLYVFIYRGAALRLEVAAKEEVRLRCLLQLLQVIFFFNFILVIFFS